MSVPRYPDETAAEPVHPDVAQAALDAEPNAPWAAALPDELAGLFSSSDAEPVHPVDAMVEVAAQMFPGQEMNPEQVAMARTHCDEHLPKSDTDREALAKARDVISRVIIPPADDELSSCDKLRGAVSQADIVPEAQDAINEMVENGWLPDALVRHLRLLGPELELWSPKPGFPRHSGLFALSAATAIENQTRLIADLEAKLDAERVLRAQAAAELEREKAHERDRRIEADVRARDLRWALDAAIEALVPLAGYATEEDGRVSGMTAPVCLAMSSVRRADALVKLHRALRR